MQAVLCDVCERPIRGQALEVHHIRGEAVHTEEGRPRVVQRGASNMYYMCEPCGGWVTQAIEHLRGTLRPRPRPMWKRQPPALNPRRDRPSHV